jgi:hypothetical protein
MTYPKMSRRDRVVDNLKYKTPIRSTTWINKADTPELGWFEDAWFKEGWFSPKDYFIYNNVFDAE